MNLFYRGDATISPCGAYRYRLTRKWGEGPTFVCIGVNPSTADADTDDATIRRVINFANDSGHKSLTMLNLFAYRSTDIGALADADEPIGIDNDWTIAEECTRPEVTVVCAWGPPRKVPRSLRFRFETVPAMLHARDIPLHVLALTDDGHPRHPLMLKSECRPTLWVP